MIPQEQRGEAWKQWRRNKLGASEISAILGCGFLSIGELFDIKLGLRQPEEENDAMRRGNDLEGQAREAFELETGRSVYPLVCVHPDYPWLIASLDGITIDKKIAVEIKCPGKKTHEATIKSREIPSYYIPQLQQIMSVTGLDEIYYFSFDPDSSILLKLSRDDEYIKVLIEKARLFHQLLMQGFDEIKRHEEKMDSMKDELYRIIDDADSAI